MKQLPLARAPRRLLSVLLVAALAACASGGDDPAPPRTIARIDVDPRAPWLVVGSTASFYATAVYSDSTTADVTGACTWSSSATGVLQLSSGVPVAGTAVSAGTATVTAQLGGVSGSAEARVIEAGDLITVAGVVTYDFVPATYDPATDGGTLAFGAAYQKPVRGAVVQVLQGGAVLAATHTDESGHYLVAFAGAGTVTIAALAQTVTPPIQVEDNTDDDAVWAIGATVPAASATVDLRATHGWTGSSYDPAARQAAPFAILDSMYAAATAFVDAGRAPSYPPLRVNWSPDNSSDLIVTSHYSPSEGEIYILGKAGEDTDEFDDHVIVHEWAHYFEDQLSRSDSPGGSHGMGDVLDPRLAFGEGYGTAIASILLQDPIYADTGWWYGPSSLVAWGFSAETPPSPSDDYDASGAGLNPGPFSEMSIIRALYDLWDAGTGEAWDAAAIPLGTIYDVLVGPEKTTPAFTTIASFVAGLRAQDGVDDAAVDAVLAHHGIGAISDEWGTGDADLRAMFRTVSVPSGTQSFTLDGRFDWNTQQQNRYLVFTAPGTSATVTGSSSYNIDLELHHRGTLRAADWDPDRTPALFRVPTIPGETYVVLLTGYGFVNGTYDATVTISAP